MVLEVLYEVPMLLGRLCATSDNSRLFGQNSPSCAHHMHGVCVRAFDPVYAKARLPERFVTKKLAC